jgi:hypothetical protein
LKGVNEEWNRNASLRLYEYETIINIIGHSAVRLVRSLQCTATQHAHNSFDEVIIFFRETPPSF